MQLRIFVGPIMLPITLKSLMSPAPSILNMNKIPRISIGTSRPHIQVPRLLTSIFHIRVNKLTSTQKSSQPLSTFAL